MIGLDVDGHGEGPEGDHGGQGQRDQKTRK